MANEDEAHNDVNSEELQHLGLEPGPLVFFKDGSVGKARPFNWLRVEDVITLVEKIRLLAEEQKDADAHIKEDELHIQVLRQIAWGHPTPGDIAREAVKTLVFDFSRWYE